MLEFTLVHPDDSVSVYDEHGRGLRLRSGGQVYTDLPNIVGIWDDNKKETTLWKDVVAGIKDETYRKPKKAYLDNGQVIEEGRILHIGVDYM